MARTGDQLTPEEIIAIEELNDVANNSMIHKDNTGVYKAIPIGALGTVPTSNGPTSDPTFQPSLGDMTKAVYDPSTIEKDLFQVSQKVYVDVNIGDDIGGNGSVNAPFKTIPAAISGTTGTRSLLIAPGTYPEDVTLDGDIIAILAEGAGAIMSGKIICNGTTFFLNMQLIRASTVTETFIDMTTNLSFVAFDFCLLQLTTSTVDIQPTLLEYGGGSGLTLTANDIVYFNGSTAANSLTTSVFKVSGTGFTVLNGNSFFIDWAHSSGDVRTYDDSGTGSMTMVNLSVFPNASNAGYTGEGTWYKRTGISGTTRNFSSVKIRGTGQGSGTFTCYDLNSSGNSQTIITQGGTANITGFTNNQYGNIATTDILESFFNNVLETMTNIGAGTCNKVDSQGGDLRVNTAIVDEGLLLGTPINESMEDLFNISFNSGWVSGADETDNLDGTVSISAGTGLIRIANTDQADIKSFDIPETLSISLVDGANNIVYVDFNAGVPIVTSTTVRADILNNEHDKFELVEIVREGTELHISDHRHTAVDVGGKVQQRLYSISPVERADETGLILGETGTRNVTVTAGNIWRKVTKEPVGAIDTSVSDTFDRYFSDGASGFTKQSAQTQWNNTQFDDGSGTLATIANNRFSFQDFYLNGEGNLVALFGGEFTSLAAAETAPTSSNVPVRLEFNSILIGRIAFQEGDATTDPLSAFTTTFSAAVTSDHGNLSGLGDDDHTQYLTETRHDALPSDNPHSVTATQVGLGNVDDTSDATKDSATATLTNKTLTSPIITTAINAQTGTTYTLVLTDQSKLVTLTNAAAIALTIPTNASVAFPIGTQVDLSADGAGAVTISGAGVTINSKDSNLVTNGQFVGVTLIKTATNTWNVYGDLTT